MNKRIDLLFQVHHQVASNSPIALPEGNGTNTTGIMRVASASGDVFTDDLEESGQENYFGAGGST